MQANLKANGLPEKKFLKGGVILALIVAIAMMKVTYSEIAFALLYLIPITLGVLWFRWKVGLVVAFACVAIGWVSGMALGILTVASVNWNAFIRLLIFTGHVLFLQMFRWELERQVILASLDRLFDTRFQEIKSATENNVLAGSRYHKECLEVNLLTDALKRFYEITNRVMSPEESAKIKELIAAYVDAKFSGKEFIYPAVNSEGEKPSSEK